MCMYLCYVCCLHVMLNLSMLEFHGNSCIQGMQLHDIYRVLTCNLFIYSFVFFNIHSLCLHTSPGMCSSSAQKYFRRATRLNWPEGAVSRESIRAVRKLDRLKVSLKFAIFAMRIYQLFLSFGSETLIRSCR